MPSEARANARLAASLKLEFRRTDEIRQEKINEYTIVCTSEAQAHLSTQDFGITKPLQNQKTSS